MTPIKINLNDYVRTGEGANGASFNHKTDPSIMMKLYFRNYEAAALELEWAKKVYALGIPTPEPGDLVTDGERVGIRFRRLIGKRSYSRACGDEPERAEEYGAEFARLSKKLHSVHVDITQFEACKQRYYKMLADNPDFTPEQKQKIHDYIAAVPDTDTALHGDLQFGNGIFTEKDGVRTPYFIDLGDFCYGNPMFDVGMVYLCACLNDASSTMEVTLMPNATSARFWNGFAKEYFGPDADMDEVMKQVKIFAGLKTLMVERDTHCPMPQFRAMLEGTIY